MGNRLARLSASVDGDGACGYDGGIWGMGLLVSDVVVPSIVSRRPSESAGVVGAITILIVRAVGVTDPDLIVALGVVVGFVPSAVTWLVALARKHNGTTPPTLGQ